MPKELESLRKKISANLKGKTNPKTKKPYTESEIYAIATEQHKKTQSKENKISFYEKVQFKEEDGEFFSEGFIATTHPDRAKTETHTGDVLTENAITSVVEQINNRNGLMADLVSHRHDWIKQEDSSLPVAGKAVTAEVRKLPYGHFGAHVKTHHNKNHPDAEKIKYEVEKGYLPGYSIEFVAKEKRDINLGDDKYRLIDSLDLKGYGLANGRLIANPNAVIETYGYKEIISNIKEVKEENKMSEENKDNAPKEPKEPEAREAKPADGAKPAEKPAEGKPAEKAEEAPAEGAKEEVDAKELAEFRKFNAMKLKETKATEMKEAVTEALKSLLPENKIQMKESIEMKEIAASIEYKEWSEMQKNEVSVKEAFNRANALAEKTGIMKKWGYSQYTRPAQVQMKMGGYNGEKIEIKALETDTNKTTTTDYLQSAAELSDIYAPAITKMLNLRTTFFGLLPKEDHSGKAMIQWRAENVANASGGFVFEGAAVTKGNTTRQKLQEEFKYFNIGVQVTGQMIESARSGVGDVFAIEIEAATRKALSQMNAALFDEKGARADEEFLGMEYIADSTGNTTLYGETRSATNLLGYAGSEYNATAGVPVSKTLLRTGLRTLDDNGADMDNVIIISRRLQLDLFLAGNADDAQRFLMSASPRVGFEGRVHFDGYPWFTDKDMDTDDIFIVNIGANGVALAVQKPLSYEDLAKSDDSRSGFLKFYGNLYAKAPKQAVYMLQGLATS